MIIFNCYVSSLEGIHNISKPQPSHTSHTSHTSTKLLSRLEDLSFSALLLRPGHGTPRWQSFVDFDGLVYAWNLPRTCPFPILGHYELPYWKNKSHRPNWRITEDVDSCCQHPPEQHPWPSPGLFSVRPIFAGGPVQAWIASSWASGIHHDLRFCGTLGP